MFKDEFFQKILLSICFLILFNPAQSFACDNELGYCENTAHFDLPQGHSRNPDRKVVFINSQNDFLAYPKDPDTLYRFVINENLSTRAICYRCGRPNLGTVTIKEQYSARLKQCPLVPGGHDDVFSTWHSNTYERCTSCGYQSEPYNFTVSWTAQCLNGDNPWYGGEWIVKYEYTQSAGYNLHQSLRYWQYYSFI